MGNDGEKTHEPFDYGFNLLLKKEIFGGDTIEEAGRIFLNVLNNTATKAQINVVAVNSAFAMQTYFANKSIQDCIAECKETIKSKKAEQLFKNLISNN